MEEIGAIVLELMKDEFLMRAKLGENHMSIVYKVTDRKGIIRMLEITKMAKHEYRDHQLNEYRYKYSNDKSIIANDKSIIAKLLNNYRKYRHRRAVLFSDCLFMGFEMSIWRYMPKYDIPSMFLA